jgi:dienelactone hydrolase
VAFVQPEVPPQRVLDPINFRGAFGRINATVVRPSGAGPYGGGPAADAAPRVCFPIQGHYAERDTPVTPRVPGVAAALKAAGRSFTPFVYPRTEHGFFNENRPTHAREAAEFAWLRSLEFLSQHLLRANAKTGEEAPSHAAKAERAAR